LIKYTLSEPLVELNGTDLEFTVEKVLAKYHGKGRTPVVGLRLTLLKKQPKKLSRHEAEIDLEKWKEFSENHKKIIDRLQKKWLISVDNLRQYLPILKFEKADNLRAMWEFKDASKEPIVDRYLYCNKAFVEAGKKAMESTNGGH
jgi:hypothetical protein